MKKIALIALMIFIFSLSAYAALEISTDHRSLFFGLMKLGEEKGLAQLGVYHNQITCSSTNGNTWYLKINLLQPLSFAGETIPLENFQWQLVWTNGNGTQVGNYQYKPFSLFPDLVYTSGPGEASGQGINFQFKYSLKIPEVQLSGVYNTAIRFTLTEVL
jgi:hypothetical protein